MNSYLLNEKQMSDVIMSSKSSSILHKLKERIELRNRFSTVIKDISNSDFHI